MSKHRMQTVLVLVVFASILSLVGRTESQTTTATWTLAKGWQIPVSVPSRLIANALLEGGSVRETSVTGRAEILNRESIPIAL